MWSWCAPIDGIQGAEDLSITSDGFVLASAADHLTLVEYGDTGPAPLITQARNECGGDSLMI